MRPPRALLVAAAAPGVLLGAPLLPAAVAAQVPAAVAAAPPPGPELRTGPDALRPDTVLRVPGGPLLVRLRTPGSPLVALRVSAPVPDEAGETAAAHVLHLMALDRAQTAARQIGATVEGERTPWGVAYTVLGPASELDYLAFVLREATDEPSDDRVRFERARVRAREEVARLQETAIGRVASRLRTALEPSAPVPEQTAAALDRLGPSDVRGTWARTHGREDLTVTAVGDPPMELLLASLQGLGFDPEVHGPAPGRDGGGGGSGSTARVQVLRRWYGEARPAGGYDESRTAVAALLVADRLRRVAPALVEARVEEWELREGRGLAVVAAAYPRSPASLPSLVSGALVGTRETLTESAVSGAVSRARSSLLQRARSPDGLARMVGRGIDATGSPAAAARLLASLAEVTEGGMGEYLAELAARSPARARVRP